MSYDSFLPFDLPGICRKKVSANFDGGAISSDGGLLLLREAERRLGPLQARRHGAGWMTEPVAHRMEDAKYGGEAPIKPSYFRDLPPLYLFRAVRSFGEYGVERDENRLTRHFGSQELFAKKRANIGDFRRGNCEERDLPKG